MSNTILSIPEIKNKTHFNIFTRFKEKLELKAEIARLKSTKKEIAMVINGNRIITRNKKSIHPPHELRHTLGYFYKGGKDQVKLAIRC